MHRERKYTPLWAKQSPPVAGMLALVDPHLPCTRGGLQALQQSNPKLHALFSRLLELATILESLQGQERKATFITRVVRAIAGLDELDDADVPGDDSYEQFAECLKIVRRAERGITRAYVPNKYAETLSAWTPLADPIELFLLGFKEQPDGWRPTDAQRRTTFEAQRDFALTMFYFGLAATKRIGKWRTREDRAQIFQFLLEQGFIAELPKYADLRSLHDPRNLMRASWMERVHGQEPPHGELEERSTKLRFTELVLPNRRIPILVEVRRKGFMQIVGKMLAVQGEGVQEVEDRRGLRFGYATLQDLREGTKHIRRVLPLTDFVKGDEGYRDNTDDPTKLLNPFSAPNLCMISFFRMMAGHRVQVQNCLATQILDLIHSRGPENHTLYHLRQYVACPPTFPFRGLFPWHYPPEIIRVEWGEQPFFEELVHHVLASLPR